MTNKSTYESADIVTRYSSLSQLYEQERVILRLLKNKLKNMKMLDIGIGGGRTTYHFAPLVKEYIGIDYSQNMIKACRKRFANSAKNMFRLGDARSMQIFKDNYFDFVFVSSNGLDYMPHNDRIKALKEIKRVGRKRGYFFFSTHNLLSINKLLEIKLSLNPIIISRNIIRNFLLKALNEKFDILKKRGYALLNDGAHEFRLLTYYIKPQDQIKQLKDLNFKNIRVFSPETGKEIIKKSELCTTTDGLHYGLGYLCNF